MYETAIGNRTRCLTSNQGFRPTLWTHENQYYNRDDTSKSLDQSMLPDDLGHYHLVIEQRWYLYHRDRGSRSLTHGNQVLRCTHQRGRRLQQ